MHPADLIPPVLIAAVPELLGSLGAAAVIAAAGWTRRRLGRRSAGVSRRARCGRGR
jgi:hypothetical protein